MAVTLGRCASAAVTLLVALLWYRSSGHHSRRRLGGHTCFCADCDRYSSCTRCAFQGCQLCGSMWFIADLTVLRLKLVRASVEDGDHVEPTVLELHAEYCQLCNGDTRKHHCVHFCWVKGCCDGQRLEVCIHRFIRLFMETVFMALGIDLPSPLRWYTYSPHLAGQTLGQTTYGILPRVLNGLVDPEALQPAGDNGACFALQDSSKMLLKWGSEGLNVGLREDHRGDRRR